MCTRTLARGVLRYSNDGNGALLRHIPPGASRVLDVGCGAGDNARILRDRGHRVWGITISEEEAEVARAFCVGLWVGDVEKMDLPDDVDPFDALVMSHILEHLVTPQRALTRLANMLRPGGTLIAAVPNMAFWSVRLRILRGDWRREDTGFFDRTHLQFWTYATFAEVFTSTPFDVVYVAAADTTVPLRPLRRVLPEAAAALDAIGGRAFPNLTASQVIVVAKRRA